MTIQVSIAQGARSAFPDRRVWTGSTFSSELGLFKNQHSHRNVPISDPAETVEVVDTRALTP
jgi:hypothetical protein